MSRIARLAATLDGALLVTNGVDVRYLTSLDSSNAAVLVTPDGEATLYTDFRYADVARTIAGVTFVETGRDLLGTVAGLLAGRPIGIDPGVLTVAAHATLVNGGVETIEVAGAVTTLRAVKEPGELDAIRRAAALSDLVYTELAQERFSGRTERELAWFIERRFRELGADGMGFPSIVGAGANGARPHSRPADAPIASGTLVVVDTGCVVDGYHSDCTRTFSVGEPDARLRELYDLCLTAHLDGLAAVRVGAVAGEVDAASRVAITAAGHAEHYGHGLGHGVGLEIHEAPWLRPAGDGVLAEGMVVTVEPGIYFAGDVGVRIEDLVIVNDNGAESLTLFTKELVTVA